MASGNWAAPRYTSARLSNLSLSLFQDIEKDTIKEWRNSYDDTELYPSVFPSKGFYNIVNGTMSFVGPRPDLEGFYDDLRGEERKVLLLKPGLTSRASIAFFNEERLLQTQDDPIKYNKEIIFPKKVTMNLDYYHHRSFVEDLKVIKETLKCFYKT